MTITHNGVKHDCPTPGPASFRFAVASTLGIQTLQLTHGIVLQTSHDLMQVNK